MVLTTMLMTGCGGSRLAEVFLEQVLVIPVSLAFPDIVSRPLIQIPKSLPGWWVAPGSPDRGGCLPSRHHPHRALTLRRGQWPVSAHLSFTWLFWGASAGSVVT